MCPCVQTLSKLLFLRIYSYDEKVWHTQHIYDKLFHHIWSTNPIVLNVNKSQSHPSDKSMFKMYGCPNMIFVILQNIFN